MDDQQNTAPIEPSSSLSAEEYNRAVSSEIGSRLKEISRLRREIGQLQDGQRQFSSNVREQAYDFLNSYASWEKAITVGSRHPELDFQHQLELAHQSTELGIPVTTVATPEMWKMFGFSIPKDATFFYLSTSNAAHDNSSIKVVDFSQLTETSLRIPEALLPGGGPVQDIEQAERYLRGSVKQTGGHIRVDKTGFYTSPEKPFNFPPQVDSSSPQQLVFHPAATQKDRINGCVSFHYLRTLAKNPRKDRAAVNIPLSAARYLVLANLGLEQRDFSLPVKIHSRSVSPEALYRVGVAASMAARTFSSYARYGYGRPLKIALEQNKNLSITPEMQSAGTKFKKDLASPPKPAMSILLAQKTTTSRHQTLSSNPQQKPLSNRHRGISRDL